MCFSILTYFRRQSVLNIISVLFCSVKDSNYGEIEERNILKKDTTVAMLLSIVCYLPTIEI